MKLSLRLIGLAGVLLFGTAFWFTYGIPGGVEDIAKDFIKQRIEQETGDKIDTHEATVKDGKLGKLAQKLLQGKTREIESLKSQLRNKAYEKSAAIIAEMSDLDCECRKIYAARLKQRMESNLSLLQAGHAQLLDFMKTKYMEVVTRLTQDLRIFTASNLTVFLLLLLLSCLKPSAISHLFLPGLLLLTSTAICSFFYLFEQNWFFTIIYNDYLGYGYLGYVALLFLLFCDIVFNKARITTEIINALLQAIGSAASLSPC